MVEPLVVAWADQIGALIRDKVRQMQAALLLTGWRNAAHMFKDPQSGDFYKLMFEDGDFYLSSPQDETGTIIVLDLEALGVPQ